MSGSFLRQKEDTLANTICSSSTPWILKCSLSCCYRHPLKHYCKNLKSLDPCTLLSFLFRIYRRVSILTMIVEWINRWESSLVRPLVSALLKKSLASLTVQEKEQAQKERNRPRGNHLVPLNKKKAKKRSKNWKKQGNNRSTHTIIMKTPPDVYPSALFVNRSALEKHFECLICSNIQKDPVLCCNIQIGRMKVSY